MADTDDPTTPDDPTDDPTVEPTVDPTKELPNVDDLPDLPEVVMPPAAASTANRGLGRIIALGILAMVLLIGVGAAGYFVSRLSGSREELTTKVPADAAVFASVYLDPSAAQKINLRRILQRFPELPGEGEPKDLIADSIDDALDADDMSYDEDIQPWLGSQIGVAVMGTGIDSSGVALIDSKDDGAAQAFIDAQAKDGGASTDYKGVQITEQEDEFAAVTNGTVIVGGDVGAIHAIIDTVQGGDSLADNPNFTATMADLPDERLGVVWVDVESMFAALEESLVTDLAIPSPVPGVPGADGQMDDMLASLKAFKGLGATVSAESDGISLQVSVPMDASKLTEEQRALASQDPHQNAALDWTPEQAFGIITLTGLSDQLNSTLGTAAGVPMAGASTSDMLEEFGIADLINAASGDAGIQVTPGTGGLPIPTGTIMVATDDEAAMKAALDKTVPVLASGGPSFGGPEPAPQPTTGSSHRGVEITSLRPPVGEFSPVTPAWAVTDGMAIIGSSVDAVNASIDAHLDGTTITDDSTFKAASSHAQMKNSSLMYFNVAAIASAVVGMTGDLGPAGNTLRQFQAVIFTQTTTEDGMKAELFVLLTDDSDTEAA